MSEKLSQINIVFLADSHLGFDFPIYPRLNRRRRGHDFFANYKKILKHTITKKADLLIHGGDVFFKSRVHDKVVDLAYEPLLEVADSGIPVFMVPGNHERGKLPVSLLLSHKNILVFNEPKTFSLHINGLDIALAGFPFQRGDIRNNFKKVLADTEHDQNRADVNLLCMHQAIEGAKVGPADYTFRYGTDTIRLSDIPIGFDAVLSGHIHRHQMLSKQNAGDRVPPVIYAGSIERTAFAEKNEDKGFVELSCSQSGIEKIHFTKLYTRPMYDLNIDQADSIDALETSIADAISDFDSNAIVRLKIDTTIDDNIKQQLNTAFFRNIFPATMNFQRSRDLDIGPDTVKSPKSNHHQPGILAQIKKNVPNKAGVYLFKSKNQKVLYVGKSVNLKQRMTSYFFQNSKQHENRIRQMVFNTHDFSFIETETELLALILENILIKKHLPDYNIKQKEFNEYRYLLLSNDNFPTLKIIQHTDIHDGNGNIYGPFKDQYFVKDVLGIIYHHLNLRQCQDKEPVQKSLNYDLGLCTGPCRGNIDEIEYSNIAQHVMDFLNGNEERLVEKLSRVMTEYASSLEYENAARIKQEIAFCQKFCKRQRFIHRFKTSTLLVHENGNSGNHYKFSNGVFVSAHINGSKLTHDWIHSNPSGKMDARYVLDLANIVYNRLSRFEDLSYFWS